MTNVLLQLQLSDAYGNIIVAKEKIVLEIKYKFVLLDWEK